MTSVTSKSWRLSSIGRCAAAWQYCNIGDIIIEILNSTWQLWPMTIHSWPAECDQCDQQKLKIVFSWEVRSRMAILQYWWLCQQNIDQHLVNMTISAGNLFKIIFRASAERMQTLPINLRYIYKRVFHWQAPIYCQYLSGDTENLGKLYAYVIMVTNNLS